MEVVRVARQDFCNPSLLASPEAFAQIESAMCMLIFQASASESSDDNSRSGGGWSNEEYEEMRVQTALKVNAALLALRDVGIIRGSLQQRPPTGLHGRLIHMIGEVEALQQQYSMNEEVLVPTLEF